MDAKSIGKILKEARMSKKLTQSEVVGDFITRNMLRQIESGTAMPSVKTLEYLCRVLDVSLDDEEVRSIDVGGYLELRQAFSQGKYQQVIDAEADPAFRDETDALKARAYLALSEELGRSKDIESCQRAVELAKKAAELSKAGIFADSDIQGRSEKALKAAAQRLTEYYNSFLSN